MSCILDDQVLKTSLDGPTVPNFNARDRQFIEISDTQNGNYSGGQIVYDLNTLVSSTSFWDTKNSYLKIPTDLTCTASGDIEFARGDGERDYERSVAMMLKGSNFSLINGITISVANQSVVSFQPLSNIPIHYQMLTTFDDRDAEILGPSINFAKDTGDSFSWDANLGEMNNDFVSDGYVASSYGKSRQNVGGRKRARSCSYSAGRNNGADGPPNYEPGFGEYVSETIVENQMRSNATVNPTHNVLTLRIFAYIPLRYLHDIFVKTPLIRGALWQMTLHTHMPSSFTIEAAIAPVTVAGYVDAGETSEENERAVTVTNPTPISMNQFMPFVISDVYCPIERYGATTVGGVQGAFQMQAAPRGGIAIRPRSVTDDTLNGGAYYRTRTNQARAAAGRLTFRLQVTEGRRSTMHCCMYDLSPDAQSKLISDPVKTIVYNDMIRYAPIGMANVIAGGRVDCNITPGMGRPRGIFFFPTIPSLPINQRTANSPATIAALNSPYTTAGATTAPYAWISDLNVSISGKNLFSTNYRHRPDLFSREQFGIGSSNGNMYDGYRAGLLSERDFDSGYCHTYVNLERHPEVSDSLPAAIDVSFVNGCKHTVQIIAFLMYEREFKINILTGQLSV